MSNFLSDISKKIDSLLGSSAPNSKGVKQETVLDSGDHYSAMDIQVADAVQHDPPMNTVAVKEAGADKEKDRGASPRMEGSLTGELKIEDENSLTIAGGIRFAGTVLTAEGGAIKVPEKSRMLCVLFDTGLWLISASHRHSPLVTSVAQSAQRQGHRVDAPRYVTPNVIRQAYMYAVHQEASTRIDSNAVRRKISSTIEQAVNAGASDIHIEASDGRTKVEFRIDGAMRMWETWTQKEGEEMLASIYSHSVGQSGATANWQEPQAAMLSSMSTGVDSLLLPKGVLSVRCQWVPLADGGRYLDMRLQYDSSHLFGEDFVMTDVDSLGFSQEQLKTVRSLRSLPGGMRVFAGPVNQGKTTTLRVTLNRRMAETNRQLNCLVIEDPPEGGIVGARQVGVSASVKDEQRERSFLEIMRCTLRLDPDIVMLGEIRDIQTAKFAFRLALTGRQVYTTTHVYSALAIPQRLRDIGMEPYLVYDPHLLRGMLCQRLLRGLCPHCRIPILKALAESGPLYMDIARRVRSGLAIMDASRISGGEDTMYDRLSDPDLRSVYIVNNDGCRHCYKGHVGRSVCVEVIETDQKLMDMLQDNRLEDAAKYWLSPDGLNGVTMAWHALEKVRRGEVSPQDAEFEVGPLAREKEITAVEQRLGALL